MIEKVGPKALETRYAGCRFRSRLEARWAVFFDRLRIPWEYESEGFATAAGNYLPDFRIRIPQLKAYDDFQWFEVKPPGALGDARYPALVTETRMPLILARGLPRSYLDQLKSYQSALMIYGVTDTAEPTWLPAAFCDEYHDYYGAYCSLGDNRHWCQEDMGSTLAEVHLGLYGEHAADEYQGAYFTHLPPVAPRIDAAFTAARSARFGT